MLIALFNEQCKKSRKKLLAKTVSEMLNFRGSHGQNTVAENNQNHAIAFDKKSRS
jgi:hypothetical protein